jgi:hypothetical protein
MVQLPRRPLRLLPRARGLGAPEEERAAEGVGVAGRSCWAMALRVAPGFRVMRQRYAIQRVRRPWMRRTLVVRQGAGLAIGRPIARPAPRLRIFSHHIGRGPMLCTGPWQALPPGA